jgi:alkyl sulfatase BDS1-like metallo-beta-lactamase superfamily hydrolase
LKRESTDGLLPCVIFRGGCESGKLTLIVVQVTNQLVFADPSNTPARLLCADAMEQLAYIAESGPWRNVYLQGKYFHIVCREP